MYNPSYLVKSRHDVYYFRYPLPVKPQRRVSVSLKTRCPKLALRLSKILEYHGLTLIEELDCYAMDYAELQAIFKDHFAKLLHAKKITMDEFGPLSKQEANQLEQSIALMDKMIDAGKDDLPEMAESMSKSIQNISDTYDLGIEPDSDEYDLAKKQYKYVLKSLYQDILAYNKRLTDYSMLDNQSAPVAPQRPNKPEYQIQSVIERYMKEEATKNVEDSTLDDKRSCLQYLPDLLGDKFPITKLDAEQARYVRECLYKTPVSRKTKKATKGKSLKEQIKIGEAENMKLMSGRNIEKYITYFKSLFDWAVSLKYIDDNPFGNMKIATSKASSRYHPFKKEQIATMLDELGKGKRGLARTESTYWGTLIAIYTGARRNEVASLLPDDIKQDKETGIWYFDITDEEETKKLKTSAAKRISLKTRCPREALRLAKMLEYHTPNILSELDLERIAFLRVH